MKIVKTIFILNRIFKLKREKTNQQKKMVVGSSGVEAELKS